MKLIGSIAVALALALAGSAMAQTSPPATGATKMSQADCTAAWIKLDAQKSGNVTESQAQGTVTNFKSADANSDGKLSQAEFMGACDKGLVSASTGAGSGSRGMTGTDNAPKK